MYKLVNSENKTGFKGKRLSNDNLKTFPKRILDLLEKAEIIEKIETNKKGNGKEKSRNYSKTDVKK